MYEILVRFKIVKNNQIIETKLDERLSFNENLKIVGDLIKMDLSKMEVYDFERKIFLNKNIAVKDYNISNFMYFYLF